MDAQVSRWRSTASSRQITRSREGRLCSTMARYCDEFHQYLDKSEDVGDGLTWKAPQ